MASSSLRCYLIGAQSLLIHCAQVLVDAGHQLVGIISSDAAIAEWARGRGIPLLALDATLADRMAADPCDYLFSIANLQVIPETVLRQPRRSSVNFHDGPLPRYAGLHATSWSLMQGEATHGITWHLIEGGIDEGRVLLQDTFPIGDGETALTLNAKCYEAGMRTFPLLAEGLASGTLQPQAQDLSQRTYFGAFKRPAAAGTLWWDRPAVEIDALARALDFGGYTNPLGLPHASVQGRTFLVTGLELVADDSAAQFSAQVTPGTIVAIDHGLRVATATTDVRITRVLTADGAPLEVSALATAFGLTVGTRLDTPPPEAADRITALHERICRHEAFWVARLETLAPIDLAYIPVETLGRSAGPRTRLDLTPSASRLFPHATGDGNISQGELSAAATLAWLARLTDAPTFDVAFSDRTVTAAGGHAEAHALRPWIEDHVPVRVALDPADTLGAQVAALQRELAQVRKRQTFTRDIRARYPSLRAAARAGHTRWPVRLDLVDRLDADAVIDATTAGAGGAGTGQAVSAAADDAVLTIRIAADGSSAWLFDAQVLDAEVVGRLQRQLIAFLDSAREQPSQPAGTLSLLPDDERARLLVEWNHTPLDYPSSACVHELIAAQAARTPDHVALIHRDESIAYRDLDARAGRLAQHLRSLGVGPDVIVGLAAERSIEMMVGLLGILKAGGAYLPLDPDYPADRLAFMVEDSQAPVVVTQRPLSRLVPPRAKAVYLEQFGSAAAHTVTNGAAPADAAPAGNGHPPLDSSHLAYVIYTSGSTGKPKGVMVTHRNVVNFFAAMDERLDHDRDGTWLAVTSLSFDISVLELLWTLARGFKVVLHGGASHAAARRSAQAAGVNSAPRRSKGTDFSFFYFSSDEGQDPADRYRLLLEGAKFADREGFAAVWTPERHFHAFGGLYPNPSVISAAIAALTSRIQIRAGSVVLPLHHPARVAEEWAVVDNLSHGRVGISFASGWQPNDFLLNPEAYKDAKGVMMRHIEVVRRLWRGETVEFPGPKGDAVPISTLPRPIQPELPVWITTAGNPDTFRMAGEAGAYVLTHLLGQTVAELGKKLQVYRDAWKASGHAGTPHVTLMLHTFVGTDDDEVRELVRGPMKQYLGSSMSLIKGYASTFPAFRNVSQVNASDLDTLFAALTPEDMDALLDHSFARYFETGGLFGTPDTCAAMVADVQAIGVDEIACLIDFGVPTDTVLANLPQLNELRARYGGADQQPAPLHPPSLPLPLEDRARETGGSGLHAEALSIAERGEGAQLHADTLGTAARSEREQLHADAAAAPDDFSLAGELRRHHVTHLQCTPSLASMLAGDPIARTALGPLRRMLVGGEALSADLAAELRRSTGATVINMYGPTETTVWSSTHALDGGVSHVSGGSIPIGRPIANTQLYILDRARQPVPIGLAGELYIGGDGVTRGYLHAPELTTQRFVPDPFASDPTARLYRTGDLARYRPDGVIEFLGRIDHQVKIRGHRIELGEIETVLRAHAGVREAVVVLREDTPGDARLVGYVSPQTGRTLDTQALRATLKGTLPDIMVPSALVVLDALPLTPNGKINRRALPRPDRVTASAAADTGTGATAERTQAAAAPAVPSQPASAIEATITAIWQEVLHVPTVGLDDNFFDLGGHSLLSVQVLGMVRERIGKSIPITDLFRFPTVRLMAGHLSGASTGSAALDRGRARADARRQVLQRRQPPRPS